MNGVAMNVQQRLAEGCRSAAQLEFAGSPEALACFHEGLGHLQAGNPGAALEAFSRSVLQAPDFAEAHIFLGLANALTHNIYPALDHLGKAAELQPDSFAAHFTLAQLNFKLRTPQKGYAAAREALRCTTTLEQRAMLTQLLKEERERERNGITRPSFRTPWFENFYFKKSWFRKSFRVKALVVAGSGVAAVLIAVIAHVR